jgi:DNA-binding SARP family transcriptional activator
MGIVSGASSIRIALLGGFVVRRGDGQVPVADWQHRNSAKTLLKVLAIQPDRRLHREQICDLLWPEAEVESASAQLRKALHTARHALEPHLEARASSAFIELNGQILALHETRVEIDIDQFRRAAAAALRSGDETALSAAIALYTGELLPQDRYEEWVEAPRRELVTTYRDMLLRLARNLEARGAGARAIECMRQLLTADPTDEDAYHHLMRLHVRAGSRHAALLVYRECRRTLAEELGVDPSPEIEALHTELISGVVEREPDAAEPSPVPDQVGRPTTPLVGRVSELEPVRERLRSATTGTGSFLLFGGEAGVGKTRLAVEVAREALDLGAAVLWGTAFEEENLLPYSVFADLLNGYLAMTSSGARSKFVVEHPELLPVLHLAEPSESRIGGQQPTQMEQARIYSGMDRLLAELSLHRTLVVVFDDLHLADASSLQLMKHLARQAPRFPWLLLATFREEGATASAEFVQFIQSCRREKLCVPFDIGGLSRDECRSLTETLLALDEGAAPGRHSGDSAIADRIFGWSQGNPLFVTELVHIAHEGEGIEASGEDIAIIASGAKGVIEERMSRLSPECKRSLALASTAGLQWPFRLIKVAAEDALDPPISEARLVDVFDEALGAHVVEEIAVGESWGYTFRHPLMQAVLYHSLSRQRRMRFHRILGDSLESLTPDEIEVIAHHYSRSDDRAKAVHYLWAAAGRATNLYANQAARAYLEELVELLETLDRMDEAAEARLALGRCLLTLADYDHAMMAVEPALARYTGQNAMVEAASSAALMAQIDGERGQTAAGIERLRPYLTGLAQTERPERVAGLYFTLAKLTFLGGQYEESLKAARDMLDVARGIEDEPSRLTFLGQAESCVGVAQQMLGENEPAIITLNRAIELSEAAADLESLSRSLNNVGAGYADAGRFAESVAYLERALEVARKVGDPTKIAWEMCVLANVFYMLGDWDRAETHLREAMDVLNTLDKSWFTAYPLIQLGMLQIARGELLDAHSLIAQAMPLIEESSDLQAARWACGRTACMDLLEGNPEAAVQRMTPMLDRPGLEEADVTNMLPIMAEALMTIDLAQAQVVAENSIARSHAQNDLVSLVDALNARGLVALEAGDTELAEATFVELLTLCRTMSYPYADAQALLGITRARRAARKWDHETAEMLDDAESTFLRLGAKPFVAAVKKMRAEMAVEPQTVAARS